MDSLRYLFFTLGILIIFCLSKLGSSISNQALDYLLASNKDISIENMAFLRGFAAPIFSILYGLCFLYFVQKGNLTPAFNLFLSLNIAGYLFCAFGAKLNFLNAYPWLNESMFVWLKGSAPLFIVLVFGLANQYFVFHYAALIYALLIIANIFVIPSLENSIWSTFGITDVSFPWIIIATCALAILATYHLIMTAPPKLNDNAPSDTWLTWLSLFALAFGAELAQLIPNNYFKTISKAVFSNTNDYNYLMKYVTNLIAEYNIYVAAVCLVLGISLFIFKTRFYFGIGIFILAFVFGGGILEFLAGTQSTLNQDNYSLVSLGFTVNKIAAGLFLGLILPLAYFAFNSAQRFSAIAAVNFIFFPIAFLAAKAFVINKEADGYLYLALFVAACAVCASGLYKLKQRLAS